MAGSRNDPIRTTNYAPPSAIIARPPSVTLWDVVDRPVFAEADLLTNVLFASRGPEHPPRFPLDLVGQPLKLSRLLGARMYHRRTPADAIRGT
jgi:hypothetical protein